MSIHLRKPDWSGTYCNTKAKGVVRTTGTPESTDCSKCRKAAGLGKYNAMDALLGMIKVNSGVPA